MDRVRWIIDRWPRLAAIGLCSVSRINGINSTGFGRTLPSMRVDRRPQSASTVKAPLSTVAALGTPPTSLSPCTTHPPSTQDSASPSPAGSRSAVPIIIVMGPGPASSLSVQMPEPRRERVLCQLI